MSFIDSVPEGQAEGETAEMYRRARAGFGYVPNMVAAFSHRPGVMAGWNALLDSIKVNMDPRRYELVTIAAAQALRSSYCMLAHGAVLMRDHYDADQLRGIVGAAANSPLDARDQAIMRFAAKVVRDATSVEAGDVDDLLLHGLTDAEVFDIAAAAAVRCFFSKTLDALGVQPDARYGDLDLALRERLVVGRPIEA